MIIEGYWAVGVDGTLRPMIRASVQGSQGSWHLIRFLIDTGADCTVLNRAAFDRLGLESHGKRDDLTGLGGISSSIRIDNQIRFSQTDGTEIAFTNQIYAMLDQESLDIPILGRDILNLFTLIVDRKRDRVVLLGTGHDYEIRASDP